jgi:hypothetical protein
MLEIQGNVTILREPGLVTTSTHVDAHRAAIYYAREFLAARGWRVRGLQSGEARLPLKLKKDRMMFPMCARSARAEGFVATREGVEVLLDASPGFKPLLRGSCSAAEREDLEGAAEHLGAVIWEVV